MAALSALQGRPVKLTALLGVSDVGAFFFKVWVRVRGCVGV
jgi:hypothetical protein